MPAAQVSGQNSVVVAGLVSRHCLHPGCHLCRPSWHISSQIQPLLVLVKIHPLRMPCRVLLWKHGWIFNQDIYIMSNLFFVFVFCFIIESFYISQMYTLFSKHKAPLHSFVKYKRVAKVMKFPFCNWNLYWVTNFVWIYGWIFTHCVW